MIEANVQLEFARAQARDTKIKLHGAEAFAGMAKAGRLVAEVLDLLVDEVKPGVTTEALDAFVFDFAMAHGAIPAPLNYRGFPKSICTSLNHVVCHGIPGPRALKEGDILNIDVTLIVDGWHGDSSRMYGVGKISRAAERLLEVTFNSLMRGVAAVKPGATTGDIGAAIQAYAEGERCSVVRDFCGHGLGRVFHDRPNILHYGEPGEGLQLGPRRGPVAAGCCRACGQSTYWTGTSGTNYRVPCRCPRACCPTSSPDRRVGLGGNVRSARNHRRDCRGKPNDARL